jgi:hypothetical protein
VKLPSNLFLLQRFYYGRGNLKTHFLNCKKQKSPYKFFINAKPLNERRNKETIRCRVKDFNPDRTLPVKY